MTLAIVAPTFIKIQVLLAKIDAKEKLEKEHLQSLRIKPVPKFSGFIFYVKKICSFIV